MVVRSQTRSTEFSFKMTSKVSYDFWKFLNLILFLHFFVVTGNPRGHVLMCNEVISFSHLVHIPRKGMHYPCLITGLEMPTEVCYPDLATVYKVWIISN